MTQSLWTRLYRVLRFSPWVLPVHSEACFTSDTRHTFAYRTHNCFDICINQWFYPLIKHVSRCVYTYSSWHLVLLITRHYMLVMLMLRIWCLSKFSIFEKRELISVVYLIFNALSSNDIHFVMNVLNNARVTLNENIIRLF